MADYSLDTASSVGLGPITFGPVASGTGTVVFGSSSPGLTAAASNITSNPWLLAGVGVFGLAGLFLYFKYGRK